MALRALLADLLAELALPQPLDELRAEEDRDQHRRHPGDQDLAAVDRDGDAPPVCATAITRRGLAEPARERVGQRLEPDRAGALDQHDVAALRAARPSQLGGRLRVGRPSSSGA